MAVTAGKRDGEGAVKRLYCDAGVESNHEPKQFVKGAPGIIDE